MSNTDSKQEALKPCPFCGGFADLRFVGDGGRGSEGNWWIGCSRNHSRATTKEEAIRKWNTRSRVKEAIFTASLPDENPCAIAGRHVCGPMDREPAKAVKNAAEERASVAAVDAVAVVQKYLHDELGGHTSNRAKWMRAAAHTIIVRHV